MFRVSVIYRKVAKHTKGLLDNIFCLSWRLCDEKQDLADSSEAAGRAVCSDCQLRGAQSTLRDSIRLMLQFLAVFFRDPDIEVGDPR